MKKEFITCLKKIIELEQVSLTQEKTLAALQTELDSLGIAKEIHAPEKTEAVYSPFSYQTISENIIYVEAGTYASNGAMICAVIGFLMGLSSSIFGAFGDAVIGAVVGAIGGAIVAAVTNSSKNSEARDRNEQARLNANAQAQAKYQEDCEKCEAEYQSQLHKYHRLLAFDKKRVELELQQKRRDKEIYKQLKKKHEETLFVLTQFYDAANIYETYRNIVAMCYISEYLQSGVCTELSGPHGAFMVYKYEMFERQKIQQLDTIISQLDQLHFDNKVLNDSLRKIRRSVDNLMFEVREAKDQILEAVHATNSTMQNISGQIGQYAAISTSQNAIIAYNQECAANELRQLKWLECYKNSLW